MKKALVLLSVLLTSTVFASSETVAPRKVSLKTSKVLIANLESFKLADGTIDIDTLSCRGTWVAWECIVDMDGKQERFGYLRAYRVAQALGAEVGFITETTRSGRPGLKNSTVYGLICKGTECTISHTARGPIHVGTTN